MVDKYYKFVPDYASHTDKEICGFCGQFRFLSNMHVLERGVCFEELFFPSVENAYQAAKWPIDMRSSFVEISPYKAKELGNQAPGFKAKKWNRLKYNVMYSLVYQKFHNNPKLGKMLLLMDGYHIEERNDWGDVDFGTNERGEGNNNLGKILMRVRDELIERNNNNKFW